MKIKSAMIEELVKRVARMVVQSII